MRTLETEAPVPAAAGADTPSDIPPRGWKQVAKAAWKEASEDNLELIAAGVAFYAFLAFVPMLTAFVLSYGLIAEPASVVQHMQTLTSVMPSDAAGIVGGQLEGMTEGAGAQTGFALLLALGIALYGASKGAGAIMTALNIAYEVPESRGFVKRTAMALAMTAGALFVLFLAILAISAMNFLESLLPHWGGVLRFALQAAFFLLAGCAVVMLLALIYRYGPNRPESKWRWITPGSALATLIWLAATAGFGLYVSNFGNYNATYGSLGAVIVFLTWLYLSAYIVLMGAELNSVLELRAANQPQGAPEARQATPEERPQDEVPAPSAGQVAGRITLYSLLLALLGRNRRTRAYR